MVAVPRFRSSTRFQNSRSSGPGKGALSFWDSCLKMARILRRSSASESGTSTLASLTGHKRLFNYLRIGGVNGDLNHDFLSRLGDWMSHAGKHIDEQTVLINENEIFVNRTKGLGTIDRETALRMCMSGPPLRATGVPYVVLRKSWKPYMGDAPSRETRSITTGAPQRLHLDAKDVPRFMAALPVGGTAAL